MLKVTDLKTSFDIKGFPALCGVDFTLQKEELATIIGPSGGGKSTLLRAIAGVVKASSGTIENSFKKISFVDDLSFFNGKEVYQTLDEVCEIEQEGARHYMVHTTLEEMELLSKDHRKIETLSAGEFLRFLLSYHLVKGADLILLDEPFSALDRPLRDLLASKLKQLTKEKKVTILTSSHHLPEAITFSDKLGILIDGKMKAYDRPIQIWQSPPSFQVAEFLYPMNLFQLIYKDKRLHGYLGDINPLEIGNIPSNLEEGAAYILGARSGSFKLESSLENYQGSLKETLFDGDSIILKVRAMEKSTLTMTFKMSELIHVREMTKKKNFYFSIKLSETMLWKL